jgi:hypothetical protein
MFRKKEPTVMELERLSDFYVMDLYDMMDDNFEKPIIPNKPIHGLRHDEVTKEDFESIAQFGRIVKNYQKLKRLEYEI